MEHIIDIQLVKEQLRLLGHEVDDGVIIDFVRGLNKVSAGAQQLVCMEGCCWQVGGGTNNAMHCS